MSFFVLLAGVSLSKCFPADFALVRMASVEPPMNGQSVLGFECLGAEFACVCSFRGVGGHVISKDVLLIERFPTLFTLVRLNIVVDHHVFVEAILVGQYLQTNGTLDWPLFATPNQFEYIIWIVISFHMCRQSHIVQ
jgi:hypothetical protein